MITVGPTVDGPLGALPGGTDLAPVVVLLAAAVAAITAAVVWSRRQGGAGTALAAMLVALVVWDVGYGAELLATDPTLRLALGDVKYAGICGMTPAWLAFILCWTGRGDRLTGRVLLALAVEPALLLVVLALPATHDLVRHLPAGAGDPLTAEVAVGPLFWVHAAYTYGLMLPATAVFIASLVRRSRAYWLQAEALAAAAVLPWVANLLFTLGVGWFGRFDLTPVGFTLMALVLVWGLLSQRLLRLTPWARSLLVDRMTDGVIVLDAYGHVVDANPAARGLLAARRESDPSLIGRFADEAIPPEVLAAAGHELVLPAPGGPRTYEVADVALPGRRQRSAGRLLVLRDVTERVRLEARLRELLTAQAEVSEQLSSSLRPAALPEVPGLALAARFRPADVPAGASSSREVGGDFYDVFAVGDEWAFTLGDVSGKGARAAATTAHARYTLRTLALAGARPADALRQLHALVLGELGDETYLTVVHGRLRQVPGGAALVLALGGHPQPLVARAGGEVATVGVPGTAIGLLEECDVTESELHLAPGAARLLFTDGVSEAREGAALFGEAGLPRSLAGLAGRSADELAGGILDRVLALPGPTPADDIALLVLQAEPAYAPLGV